MINVSLQARKVGDVCIVTMITTPEDSMGPGTNRERGDKLSFNDSNDTPMLANFSKQKCLTMMPGITFIFCLLLYSFMTQRNKTQVANMDIPIDNDRSFLRPFSTFSKSQVNKPVEIRTNPISSKKEIVSQTKHTVPWVHRVYSDSSQINQSIVNAWSEDEEDRKLFANLLSRKCPANLVDWTSTVAEQLEQWREHGVTRKQTEEFCVRSAVRISHVHDELRLSMYKLDKKNLHRSNCGLWLMQTAIKRASARGFPIPPFEINMKPGDSSFSLAAPRLQWSNAAPLLGNIKCGGDASVSFPFTLHDMFGEGDGRMSIALYKTKYEDALTWNVKKWKDKKSLAFFSAGAGAITRGNRSNIYKVKRADLLNASTRGTTMSTMGEYKYNIYAYGHCGWSRRVKELAMLDTVVLMEESICHEYVHHMFKNKEDYLPVTEDFSNLTEVLLLAKNKDDGEMKKVAERWGSKGRAMLDLPCTLDYVEQLLRTMASLQRFTPEYHPDWSLYTTTRDRLWFGEVKKMDPSTCIHPDTSGEHHRAHAC
eukprot:m.152927 g.152927  ORF g.152927 m.152927 type:complete len:538 (+) comp15060_c0_seq1:197-1810(+)